MSYNFADNAAIAARSQYHWKATNIQTRDMYITDGATYQVNQGTLIVFLEFCDAYGRKCNPIATGVPAGMEKVRYVITPAGKPALPAEEVDVDLDENLSYVQIDTKGLSGAYEVRVVDRTIYFDVGQHLQSPAPAVIAKPKRPPTGPTGNA
ncbi:hypothetical protein TCE0_050f18302 [Talaromyces pinophilus]|uniref:Uncharacterized protein n=1 Tax=Talaromyces pinophilus TaxID=128442 RepID=A0A0B8MZA5_TALPI|nr:hypothetical protein TCE0_050f18302 [Talaromyces pinophilus]